MSAERLRIVSTWFSGMFVSALLVIATVSAPLFG